MSRRASGRAIDKLPEEINRILTDSISDLLFTPSIDGDENLIAEGSALIIHFVGNIMIDSLFDRYQGLQERPWRWLPRGLLNQVS